MKKDNTCYKLEDIAIQIESLANAIYTLGFFIWDMDNEFDRVNPELLASSIQEIARTIKDKSKTIVDTAFHNVNDIKDTEEKVNRI